MQGHLGARLGYSALCACSHRNSPEAEIRFRTSASLSPKTQPHPSSRLWGFSLCKGFCCLVVFLVTSLYLGDGVGGLRMQGSAPVLSQRPIGPPTPSCSICVQRAKCPPLPAKKSSPQPVKMAGGAQRGDGSIPLSKARIQIKKNIIIIII